MLLYTMLMFRRVLASLLAHQVDEAGTRLQDHDEVRARTVPSEGPPSLENYLAYATLPTAGSARPLLLPRQQTTPRHTGISLGDGAPWTGRSAKPWTYTGHGDSGDPPPS